jgi:hypothetical protein
MKKNYGRGLLSGCLSLVLLVSCDEKKEDRKVKEDKEAAPVSLQSTQYDLARPVGKWSLSDSLAEISGIVLLKNNNMLAIEDIHPILYEIRLGDSAGVISKKTEFRKIDDEKFDFEDIAVIGDTVYALWSHGAVFKIVKQKKGVTSQRAKTWLRKDNNTEGLAFDPVTGNLLIACKEDAGIEDAKKSTRAVFVFDTRSDSLKNEPFMLINKKDFENVAGDKIDFYPSAIGVHPVTYDIFIISTKDTKAIAQFTHDGKLKAFDYLDKSLLPQPEGICFDAKGDLYISTEARHGKPAYIYKFTMKVQGAS